MTCSSVPRPSRSWRATSSRRPRDCATSPRAKPFLVIKGGVLDGKALTPDEIVKLADLESREVLLAKLAGAMKASMSGAAATFAALPTQMARLLAALQEKQASQAPGGAEEQVGGEDPDQDSVEDQAG